MFWGQPKGQQNILLVFLVLLTHVRVAVAHDAEDALQELVVGVVPVRVHPRLRGLCKDKDTLTMLSKGASRYDVRIGGGHGKADIVTEVV